MQTQETQTLVTSLALQQVREIVTRECICKTNIYIILALTITILGLAIFAVLHSRKLKLCRGCLFSNAMKIMLFIPDVQYNVPIKLSKTTGSIHLFKITVTLIPENVKLR